MTDTISIKIRLEQAEKFAAETRIAKVAKGLGSLVKPAAILAGLGLVVQAFNAAAAGGIGFIGAIAPLGGLLGAVPAAALGAAQGLGVLKLAFSGVSGALGGLNSELEPKKFEKLSRPAQAFVLTLNSMKAPIRDLQAKVQNGLFPGLTKGLDRAKPALAALLGPLGATGGVLGGVGAKLGGLVGSKGFSKDLGTQAEFNNRQLGRLGDAGIHVLDVLRELTVTSRPLVSWLVKLAGGWAATADKTARADRANGKLVHDFQIVRRATDDVFKVTWNLGKALFNIADLGRKKVGESLLGSLVKGSEALDRWTESGPGISKIAGFFEKAKPVIYAVALLVGAITKDLLNFGQGQSGGLVSFAGKVRTELLPQFLKLSEVAIKIFDFFAKTVPGGSWLLTIAYTLHKLGAGSLLSGALSGIGKSLGVRIAGGLAAEDGAFAAAGNSLGIVMAGALIAAVVLLAKSKLGHEIEEALGLRHKHKTPLEEAFSNPTAVTPESLLAMSAKGRGELRRLAHVDKERHYPAFVNDTPSQLEKLVHGEHSKTNSAMRDVEAEYDTNSPRLHGQGPTLHAPAEAEVKRIGSARERGDPVQHIHTHVTLKLDSTPIAEGTSKAVARHDALK